MNSSLGNKMIMKYPKFDKNFLELSTIWLSDPEVKYLTLAPKIDVVAQFEWFIGLSSRKDYLIWGVQANSEKIGVAGLKHIDYTMASAEYFGYIGEKKYWNKGIGSKMIEHAINKAKECGIRRLFLKVTPDNERAIHLYKKFGFKESAVDSKGIIEMSLGI